MANIKSFSMGVSLLLAYLGGVCGMENLKLNDTSFDIVSSHPASLAVIIMSIMVPGLALLACFIGSVFICWNRDRIPIFRSKGRHSKPDAKVQVPISPGEGYPTQQMRPQKSAGHEDETRMEMKEPVDETDLVVAVEVNKEPNKHQEIS